MTGPVGDMPHQCARCVQELEQPRYYFAVGKGAVAPDVVSLPYTAVLKHRKDCAAVIVDEEPVSDLKAVAVNGQRLGRHDMRRS